MDIWKQIFNNKKKYCRNVLSKKEDPAKSATDNCNIRSVKYKKNKTDNLLNKISEKSNLDSDELVCQTPRKLNMIKQFSASLLGLK